MSNFISMFQYEKDVFSVVHKADLIPQVNDSATVYHRTALHKREKTTNALNIIEVMETRNHKTDPKSMISIVKCEPQI